MCTAQNLTTNGAFDTNLSDWDLSGSVLPVWSTMDYADDPLSGSAQLENIAPDANVREAQLRQCLHLEVGHHLLSASGYIASTQPAGRLVVSFIQWRDATCSKRPFDAGGFYLQAEGEWNTGSIGINVQIADSWTQLIISIEKDSEGGSLHGHVDDIRVVFAEEVFANGFEVDAP